MKALIFFLYRLLQIVFLPFAVLYLSVRALRQHGYGVGERLGGSPNPTLSWRTQPGGIWFHAVSVGEVLSTVKLIRQVRETMPGRPIFLSVGTVAGREMADSKLAGVADQIFYAPFDYVWCVRRVLRGLRPSLLVIVETEIWPNLWHETVKTGAALIVVNGRLSDRAWPRYWALRWFFGPIARLPRRILAQDATSCDRYRLLGASAEMAGNLKYDFDPTATPPPAEIADALARWGAGNIWIAASTMPPAEAGDPDEDDAVIGAFQSLAAEFPTLLLILVPRRPARFDEAAAKLEAKRIRFVRRSALGRASGLPELPAVLLLDSMGELGSLFQVADVVFMGGTLASRGGHNILEPAFAARPVITGPHMENFAEIADAFRAASALIEISSAADLAGTVGRLLRDGDGGAGERGRQVARAGKGATKRAIASLGDLAGRVEPRIPASLPARLGAALWRVGAGFHRGLGAKFATGLSTPVVSIGGIAVGGSGKTPLAIWVAGELRAAGRSPGFLTRGYRRAGRGTIIALPGEKIAAAHTGDEAQILLRAGAGPVGISANRADAARLMVAGPAAPDVFVLDDGFQHHGLRRDLDIVALDGLDPFGGGRELPAGSLREPLCSLRYASAIVLTRTEPGRSYRHVHDEIRKWNDSAPIFHARNVLRGWRDQDDREAAPEGPVAAFCGLGNPASFWRSLESQGLEVRERWGYPDHHSYSREELARMRARALGRGINCLVTTEKDLMNLPGDSALLLEPIKLLWLKLATEVDGGSELLALVLRAVGRQPA